MDCLEAAANEAGVALEDSRFAKLMDSNDPLAFLRSEFEIPSMDKITGTIKNGGDADCTYLCGNSLGLLPKKARQILNEEMDEWSAKGVVGHHSHSKGRPWIGYRKQIVEKMAPMFGAKPIEVGVMNTLTVNLHLMLAAFYKPTPTRFKILIEHKAFPSDHYAIESQIQWHKLPSATMLLATPREGEHTLRTSDILELIEREGSAIAVVILSGVQYYTGQVFEMEEITAAAQAKGCVVGWDLAHAAGNIPVKLHDWNVDFACWCTYKYMNSGPGGISGFFVHERYAHDSSLPRLLGWWAHDEKSRFEMTNKFVPNEGAAGFEISNTPIITAATLLGSLKVFEQTSMDDLRAKSVLLTTYLEYLLTKRIGDRLEIITPKEHRGAQLSLLFDTDKFESVFHALMNAGVICDERKPNCIRIAPAPLYNTFGDVWKCVDIICHALA
ncbi:Kynureninase (L-kynurenine hydrolase) [Coemansia sp. RSA 1813]|nr:Kynureninase (L-kynurenine hydrolase) [Coemansia sp. RSA 1646]KAJ1772831.1 Kynureninase (L-kynurenine hydrolase) [Coemansia sp. RSA 1843]KAJ2088903.1 Kynureninase (L-kynurenine hydrolase) [Coemansia sp. RSA 986]KAJ2213944.1 Kynureninase (L-kynurenine hydrolase) [Coemansia sp. RSA 487]KAJ2568748.1 Kynureninase (L-kynurenine hydrolase) [Coemansia sp. RSA 1813]